jgi:hypothetical protein
MKTTRTRKLILACGFAITAAAVALTDAVGQQSVLLGATASSSLDRTVLPIKEPTYPESTVLDVRC